MTGVDGKEEKRKGGGYGKGRVEKGLVPPHDFLHDAPKFQW